MPLQVIAADGGGGVGSTPAVKAPTPPKPNLPKPSGTQTPSLPVMPNQGTPAPTMTTSGAPQAPTLPTYTAPKDFQFNYNYLTQADAQKQAEGVYNPLYDQAVKNIQSQQYQNELDSGQSAATRGLGHSGLAQDALTKIAIASQGQIADANAQKMSQVAQMANQMMQFDQNRGDNLRSQMYNEYNSDRNFGYGQYRDQVNDAWTKANFDDNNYWKQQDQNNWQTTFDYNKGQDSIHNAQTDAGLTGIYNGQKTLQGQQFDYNKSQDAIHNNQWQQNFDYGKSQDAIKNGQWQQDFNYKKAIDNRDWSQMSPAQQQQMALQQKYDMAKQNAASKSAIKSASGNPYMVTQPPPSMTTQKMPDLQTILQLLQQQPGNNTYLGHPVSGSTADLMRRAQREYPDDPKLAQTIVNNAKKPKK